MDKMFLHLNIQVDPDGVVRPVSFQWQDGLWYEIDRILDVKRAASLKVGGKGIQYTCSVQDKTVLLFRDGDQWYLEPN